jgi:hypothetical protein
MSVRRADDNAYTLAANVAATGAAVAIKGGQYTFMAEGTVGGATVFLQGQSPNGTWSPVLIFAGSAVSFTALPNAQTGIDLPAGNVRFAVTGGAPSALYAYLIGLG